MFIFLYCLTFSYREIWEIQKDAFIRRYQRLNPQVSSFDADIARWEENPHSVFLKVTTLTERHTFIGYRPRYKLQIEI